jgi:hypothetical protein
MAAPQRDKMGLHESGSHSVMASPREKAQCVLWYAESKSVVSVQRNFRRVHRKDAPADKSVRKWYQQFQETGSVVKGHSPGRPNTSQDDTQRIRVAFQRSPKRSVLHVSRQLQIPKSTVHDVVHRRLKLRAHKPQLMQHIQPRDKPQRVNFVTFMLEQLNADYSYLQKILFSDEAIFHTHGVVNRHNCRIWGSENPHALMEHVHDSSRVNMWCGIMSGRIVGPFVFHESTITSAVCLDMLENFVFPQIAEVDGLIFQQDVAPPHFGAIVRTALDERFHGR